MVSSQQVIVVAAHVSTRVRFSDVWEELTVLIPSTELNTQYWGQGVARDKVKTEVRKLGFNGRTQFLGWVTAEHKYIKN